MYLSNVDILKEIKSGRLSISPFDEAYLNQASYDLALSDTFWVPKRVREPVPVSIRTDPHSNMKKIKAKYLELEPGQFCLALTKEKIKLPNDLIGILGGRSRFARMGLTIHVTSAVIQPGSNNHQVLELVNLSPFKLRLIAGERISQVYFVRLSSPTDKPYATHGTIATKQ